jgi:DNA-binding transcriptional LysR family regulator
VIAPPQLKLGGAVRAVSPADLPKLLHGQRWLLISAGTTTGTRLRAWLERNGLRLEVALHADSFDFIVNLVSLGLGVSFVPHRVLALHPNRRPVQRITLKPKFSRELIVAIRRQRTDPAVVTGFVENVLF